ncbi:MAG: UDP-N-acetylmuramate dehydrogenase [Candidatus Pacebacteria bacterium]|nr:UDP-N-acetylmuramate dehydrogenase [Candidatus Paceibacterota bacterium]
MPIRSVQNIPLSSLSTFRMGGIAKRVLYIESEEDLNLYFNEKPENEKWFLLGGGSNVVFPDGDCDTTILKLHFGKVEIDQRGDKVFLIADGGANWDEVVSIAVSQGLSGIEALSAIPGTVGATPVQNVGAYGTETMDVLESLRAYDVIEKKFVTFSNQECEFTYRDSIFKRGGKGRYIITQVTYLLSADEPDVPQYPGVAEYFVSKNIVRPTLQEIRDAIISIRAKKLPDPKEIASVGSFFKNSIVSKEVAGKLLEKFPTMKIFPAENDTMKVPSGWIIEQAGFKGKCFGNLSVYSGNALVIVNEGGATRRELQELIEKIQGEVEEKFGIKIEPEPELLSF